MHTIDDRARGLYEKFHVERTDGRSAPGEKHAGCAYFVLDLDHDPLAMVALQAYEDAARKAGYHQLADDLRFQRIGRSEAMQQLSDGLREMGF